MSDYEQRFRFEAQVRKHFPTYSTCKEEESGDYVSINTQRLYWIWESAREEITRLQSEVERLRGRCGELEEALRPFAEEAEYVPDYATGMHLNYEMDGAEILEYVNFDASDIHRAAQRLRQQADEVSDGT